MRADPQASDRMQPGTRRRALFVFLMIALVVAIVAVIWPDHRGRTQIELYLRQGTRQAAVLLKRDIDQLSPEGQDPGPALQHLGSLGLNCDTPVDGLEGQWTCLMRRPGEGRQMMNIEATITVRGGRVTGSTASVTEVPR